jgi:BirA family transcriptional regulator, biotin operon repressor / biotin---[acetyl-CoA-carboxylase] ligase
VEKRSGFVPQIIRLEHAGSTNEVAAAQCLSENPMEGTVIWAMSQTQGKGQGDHSWLSEPGMNLTFSLILRPLFLEPERQFLLNKALALGLHDFISSRIPAIHFRFKWPNDLYGSGKKLAGMLINNTISGNEYAIAVAGFGLNVNQECFPPELPNALSMRNLTGIRYDLAAELNHLLACLSARYLELQTGYEQTISDDYRNLLLGADELLKFSHEGTEFIGIIRGVDEFGRIEIGLPDGRREVFAHGEIQLPF